jgi:lysophospholipase L1-like esterase
MIFSIGIFLAVFFFIIFYLFMGEGNVSPTRVSREGPIIFFGDSLVEGVGATQGNDLPSQLSRRLGEPVLNAGKSGDTTALALLRLERDVLSQNPKLVIILLGGNDAIRRVPPDETFANLSLMIDRIQEQRAGVVLLGVRGGIFGDPFRERFQTLAREKKIFFVPGILEGILGNPELMSDLIHPNDRGYAKMADKIEPIVREALR